MAPRRNSNISSSGNSSTQQQQQHQQQLQQQHQTQQQQLLQFYAENANSSGVLMAPMQGSGGVGGVVRCCLPSGDCRKLDSLIPLNELALADCIRVLCNNENCSAGQYMHRECFELWEAGVLQTLKANGRARSWSERQRLQHLWTKKGYELVHKACSCKCGRGQLRKDLEWVAPTNQGVLYLNGSGNRGSNGLNGNLSEDDDKKKAKKKRNRNGNGNSKAPLSQNNGNSYGGLTPNPNVGVIGSGLPHNSGNTTGNNGNAGNNGSSDLLQPSVVATLSNILNPNNVLGLDLRARAGSLSSSGAGSGSTSPSASQSSGEIPVSPVQQLKQTLLMQPVGFLQNGLGLSKNLLIAPQQQQQQQNNLPALANISNFKPLASYEQQQLVQQQKNKEVELYSERVRGH
nr:headcase protein-like isoform X2 [Drosophila suzukii]